MVLNRWIKISKELKLRYASNHINHVWHLEMIVMEMLVLIMDKCTPNSHVWLDGHDVIIARLHIISFHIILTLINFFCFFVFFPLLSSIYLRLALWSPQYPRPQIQPCNPNHEIPPSPSTHYATHHNTLFTPSREYQDSIEREEIKFIFSPSPPRAPRSYLLRTPVLCGSHSSAQRIRCHLDRPRVRITTVYQSDHLFNPG